jgi:hypothetical protein
LFSKGSLTIDLDARELVGGLVQCGWIFSGNAVPKFSTNGFDMPCPSCHASPKMSLGWGTMEVKEGSKRRWWKPREWVVRCQHCGARFEVKHNRWVQLFACLAFPVVINVTLKLHVDAGVFMLAVLGCGIAVVTAVSLTRNYHLLDGAGERVGSNVPR